MQRHLPLLFLLLHYPWTTRHDHYDDDDEDQTHRTGCCCRCCGCCCSTKCYIPTTFRSKIVQVVLRKTSWRRSESHLEYYDSYSVEVWLLLLLLLYDDEASSFGWSCDCIVVVVLVTLVLLLVLLLLKVLGVFCLIVEEVLNVPKNPSDGGREAIVDVDVGWRLCNMGWGQCHRIPWGVFRYVGMADLDHTCCRPP